MNMHCHQGRKKHQEQFWTNLVASPRKGETRFKLMQIVLENKGYRSIGSIWEVFYSVAHHIVGLFVTSLLDVHHERESLAVIEFFRQKINRQLMGQVMAIVTSESRCMVVSCN
jgi:hypothetical protein